jgi:hypothetical protein
MPLARFLAAVDRLEGADGRPVQHAPERIEPGTVTGAVPRTLGVVPGDDAPQVRAHGGVEMERSRLVPVRCHPLESVTDECAGTGRDLVVRIDVAPAQILGVLGDHVQVLFREIADSADRHPARIVETGPRVLAADDEIGEQDAGHRAVRHSHARVTGRDVDTVAIPSDVGESVEGFENLP